MPFPFNNFKISTSQLKSSVAAQLNIGGGLFDTTDQDDQMAYILDALCYKDVTITPAELDDNSYEVRGCGLRISLKYKAFTSENEVSIGMLKAALKLNRTSVDMTIEGPGLGAGGLSAVLDNKVVPGTQSSLDNIERKMKTIYGNLLTYMQTHQTDINEVSITIPILGKDEDNFSNTQSMLYAANCIVNNKSLSQANASGGSFNRNMIAMLYFQIMGKVPDDQLPTQKQKTAAQKWKYLN